MFNTRRCPIVGFLVVLVAVPLAQANVSLPHFFTDHMVVQRDQPISGWGWAEPGEAVQVMLGRNSGAATADAAGRWLVQLPALPATEAGLELTVAGKNSVTLNDVVAGDVWVCSGQSNMEMGLGGCNAPEAQLDGNTVVVSSPNVPQPAAVRYAFSMNPTGANLYNRDGLPASPFRTDE